MNTHHLRKSESQGWMGWRSLQQKSSFSCRNGRGARTNILTASLLRTFRKSVSAVFHVRGLTKLRRHLRAPNRLKHGTRSERSSCLVNGVGCHWQLAASAGCSSHWRTSRQWHPILALPLEFMCHEARTTLPPIGVDTARRGAAHENIEKTLAAEVERQLV